MCGVGAVTNSTVKMWFKQKQFVCTNVQEIFVAWSEGRKEVVLGFTAVISERKLKVSAWQVFRSTAEEMKRRCTFVAGIGGQEVKFCSLQ